MQRLAGILFEMQALNAHNDLLRGGDIHHNFALTHDGMFVLADLIALRQIGIEIILTVKDGPIIDLCLQTKTGANGLRDAFTVDHWQHAGHGRIHQRHMGIGCAAKFSRSRRKEFGVRAHLSMNLHAHDDFPIARSALDQLGRLVGLRRLVGVRRLTGVRRLGLRIHATVRSISFAPCRAGCS